MKVVASEDALFHIVRAVELHYAEMQPLIEAARSEQFRHMDRLWDDWSSQKHRFDRPGDALFLARRISDDSFIGVGGVTLDKLESGEACGRLRRYYVLPAFRRQGIASELVRVCLEVAFGSWSVVRLNTDKAHAFYESLGFVRTDEAGVTHRIDRL